MTCSYLHRFCGCAVDLVSIVTPVYLHASQAIGRPHPPHWTRASLRQVYRVAKKHMTYSNRGKHLTRARLCLQRL